MPQPNTYRVLPVLSQKHVRDAGDGLESGTGGVVTRRFHLSESLHTSPSDMSKSESVSATPRGEQELLLRSLLSPPRPHPSWVLRLTAQNAHVESLSLNRDHRQSAAVRFAMFYFIIVQKKILMCIFCHFRYRAFHESFNMLFSDRLRGT